MTRRLAVVLAFALGAMAHPAPARTQSAPGIDRFADVAFLVGAWTGTAEGQPGTGTSKRTYERVLNGRFLRVDNESRYAPQPKNPKGEVHHDSGFISFDEARKKLVLRQFHVEGFVNQYVQQAAGQTVFVSEAIENIPPGYRARETYRLLDANRFEETFELAEPGKEFELYSRTTFTRSR